ncbi:MAG TPA: ATP-binding protein [Acidimicrobiales bacterium]
MFPFDAVVGQEDAKLALRLAAVDPRIGGVLLRGEKGSAKTTLVRGFAVLLGDVPFVELPLGATEDRVVGSLDTRAALVDGEVRFHPGLLASAHGGVLYVDEINLLADHLVDVLLDVAVSGENVVERDGISHRHPAHFVLVGSMNPEEGELRPQLLDRFGLCVDIRASSQVEERVESVRRRIEFDATGSVSAEDTTPVVTADLEPAALPDDVLVAASRLALEVGAEGLRADLVLSRAAAALAALEAREEAGVDDLRRVAPLVLAHRSRRGPFDPPVLPPEDLDRAVRSALDMDRSAADGDRDAGSGDPPSGGPPDQPIVLGSVRRPPTPPAERGVSPRGRVIGDASAATGGSVAVLPTVRALAARRATGADPNSAVAVDDLRSSLRVSKRSRTIVLCVDLSGSMGAPERAAAATGTVLGLLGDAYERRDRVALVGFRGDGAEVLVSPTSSVEVARNRLEQLATGGATPLAEGVLTALQVARAQPPDTDVLLALLTDGRATGSGGFDRALDAAGAVRRAGVPSIVLDCESGARPLGLALQLADAMHARHVFVHELQPEHLTRAIRASVS